MEKLVRSLALGVLCLGTGCGESSSGDEPTGGTTAVGGSENAGGNAGGTTGGTSTPAGGASESSGGTSTTGGTASPTSAFDNGSTVAVMGNRVAASLTITEDELELFFVHVLSETEHPIMVLKRPSTAVAFSDEPVALSAVQAACAATDYPTIDVSNDGLRMYFTCLDGSSPLRLATRVSKTADWVVADGSLGTVADSIGISDDELSAVAVTGLADGNPRPVLYRRSSIDEPFAEVGPASIDQYFANPDLACQDETLFGVVMTGDSARIASSKPGAQFGAYSTPNTSGMPVPPPATEPMNDYTPTVTPDCRRIYFLRATYPVSGEPQYTVQVARRE